MNRIRSEEGLTYGISSQFVQRHRAGPFAVFTFTRVPKVGEVVTGILEELERIRREPPSTEELARVQSQRSGQFALGLETSSEVAAALVDLDVYGLPRDSLDSYRGRVRAMTPRDTAAAAAELIDPARASIVVVGPAEQLRPQLAPFGPVEVLQPLAAGVYLRAPFAVRPVGRVKISSGSTARSVLLEATWSPARAGRSSRSRRRVSRSAASRASACARSRSPQGSASRPCSTTSRPRPSSTSR
jgi:hypothetical protein